MSQPSTSNPKKKLTTNKQMLGLVTIDFQIQRCYVKQSIPKQCTAHLLSARHKMLFEERLGGEERRLMHLVSDRLKV